jgi:5-(aminomethyl)-3-furanmethanol phosphate kinase
VSESLAALVLKLGGSLAQGRHLRAWLAVAADQALRGIIIVPGGGSFADHVRLAQQQLAFGDAAAHRMALLAMEQYAIAMVALEPRLSLASSPVVLARRLAQARAAVWRPSLMVLGRPDLPESWGVTSDSLACWLATEIGAARLVLVKSAPPASAEQPAALLAAQGLVDPAFPRFLDRYRGEAYWIAAEAHGEAAASLARGEAFGTPIRRG